MSVVSVASTGVVEHETAETVVAMVVDWLEKTGPVQISAIVEKFGVPAGTVDSWVVAGQVPRGFVLADRSTAHVGHSSWSLGTAAEAVRDVWARVTADAAVVGDEAPRALSVGLYDRNRGEGDPSPALITSRWGWGAVCVAAGVPCGVGRSGYVRKWETGDLLRWVGRYTAAMIAANQRVTFEGFDRWRAGQTGCPSGALVRTRLRSAGFDGWADMVAGGVALLRAEDATTAGAGNN